VLVAARPWKFESSPGTIFFSDAFAPDSATKIHTVMDLRFRVIAPVDFFVARIFFLTTRPALKPDPHYQHKKRRLRGAFFYSDQI